MATVAISRILYGAPDGSVYEIGIGDNISDLPEETQRELVVGGSAVETGKERKFSVVPGAAGPVDEETTLRDSLIAKANSGVDDEEPTTKKATRTPGGASAQNPQPKPE